MWVTGYFETREVMYRCFHVMNALCLGRDDLNNYH